MAATPPLGGAERERMLEKLVKLLKVQERAGTEGEQQSATLRIQEMLLKYRLSLAEVQEAGAGAAVEEVVDLEVLRLDNVTQWKWYLLYTLCDNFRCKPYKSSALIEREGRRDKRENAFHLVGLRDDATTCARVYRQLLASVELVSDAYVATWWNTEGIWDRRSKGQSRALKTSWIDGFLQGLRRKFADARKALPQSMALILVTPEAVVETYDRTVTGKPFALRDSRQRDHSGDAFRHGLQTGKTISLEPSLAERNV